jgi:negative regulator of flagellin synthesis FlgM
MRIGLFNSGASSQANELSSQQLAAQNQANTSRVQAEGDRATLTSDSVSVGSLVSKALESPEIRQDKVSALRQSISSGQYKLEPEKIAASIVDDYA